VEFRGGIDLGLQQLPMEDGHVIIDRRSERIGMVLAEIDALTNEGERGSARQYLQLFAGSRYDGQEQLYIQNCPVKLIDDALRHRVLSMLIHCLAMKRGEVRPHGATPPSSFSPPEATSPESS
jgi:hypothetical protein